MSKSDIIQKLCIALDGNDKDACKKNYKEIFLGEAILS